MSDIRSIVRQILLEELQRYGGEVNRNQHVEKVTIGTSKELNEFALKVLRLSKTKDLYNEIQTGSFRFELIQKSPVSEIHDPKVTVQPLASFDKGLVTEKHIAKLEHAARISVGKGVCFTPLARDEIRRRGIKIERKRQ